MDLVLCSFLRCPFRDTQERIGLNANLRKDKIAFVQNYFQRLEQSLAARHLSKGDLAAHLGVAASTVSRWKDAAPRAETVLKTAKWLGVDANWLLTGEAQKKPEKEWPIADNSAKPNLSMTDEELFPSTTAAEWVRIREQLSEYAHTLHRLDIQARMLTLKERMAAAGSWPPDDADLKLPLAEVLRKYPPPSE